MFFCPGKVSGSFLCFVAVIHRADNDRPIGIAVLIFHHDFIADTRNKQGATLEARPELADANAPEGVLSGALEPVVSSQ